MAFRDPAALAPAIEVPDEIRDDPRHQRLEALVVAVLGPVQFAVPLHHPAHVAGAMPAQTHMR
ncbi:hypothetical protein D3C83_44240 [compost metagenome]